MIKGRWLVATLLAFSSGVVSAAEPATSQTAQFQASAVAAEEQLCGAYEIEFLTATIDPKYLPEMSVRMGQGHRADRRYYYSFPRQMAAPGERVFIFDPKKLQWGAYDSKGRLVAQGRASGGGNYCPDVGRSCRTPTGVYRIGRKGGPGCRSSKYPKPKGGAPMPYCMFFKKSYAIHGSPNVPKWNASHGCIRVYPDAAAWLSKNFLRSGTKVIVRSY